MYGVSAPSFTGVKCWAAEFKPSCKNLVDDELWGHLKTETTGNNISKVYQMVLDERRIKVGEKAEGKNCGKRATFAVKEHPVSPHHLTLQWSP